MERYEFNDGKSNKFWEVEVTGSTLTVHYGKIGTQGQTKDKDLASSEAALKERAKLIKEKTSKGYVAAGSVAVPARPAPLAAVTPEAKPASPESEAVAAPQPAVAAVPPVPVLPPLPDDGARIESGTPLPTHRYPAAAPELSAEQAWEKVITALHIIFRSCEAGERGEGKLRRKDLGENAEVFDTMLETPLSDASGQQVADWYRSLKTVFIVSPGVRLHGYADFPELTELFMQAVLGIRGGEFVIHMIPCIDFKGSRYTLDVTNAWEAFSLLALRKVLPSLPEDEYQRAVECALAVSQSRADPQLDTFLAFVLADDRPEQRHALQPRQVLEAAAARGQSPAEHPEYLPLLAEVIDGVPPAWRNKKGYSFFFAYAQIYIRDIAATVCARAREQGASPVPVLVKLMQFAEEHGITELACWLMDTREPGVLGVLLGMKQDKWIRNAIDKGLEVHPRWMFCELLDNYVPSTADPTVKGRLLMLYQRYGAGMLQEWSADRGPRVAEKYAKLIDSEVQLASKEQLPRMLQDPPWRRKQSKKSQDLELDLQLIRTPLEIQLDEAGQQDYLAQARQGWSSRNSSQLTSVAAIRSYCEAIEKDLRTKPFHGPIGPPATPLPAAGCTEDVLVEWLDARLKGLLAWRNSWISASHPYKQLIGALLNLPEAFSLRIWQTGDVLRSGYGTRDGVAMCIRFGEAAVEGFSDYLATTPTEALQDAQKLGSSCFAPFVACALAKVKKARAEALSWFARYPRAAVYGLVPDAVGKAGTARTDAEVALRWMHENVEGFQTVLDEVQLAYATQDERVAEALQQVLRRDPLEQVPVKYPKLPEWFVPATMSRPRLVTGQGLPDEAVRMVGEMLSFNNPDAPYGGIEVLRQACTPQSLANFTWDLFSTWLAEGAVGKENWALRALGWFGDDEVARRLTPLIRTWPGESAHARAVVGLDVLADIGTDVALMHLNRIAERLRFKGLQAKAREKIAAIAEARDLTSEELADRLVPDFNLDARGGLDLDFGPRQFRVGFDEFLKPWVKDASGMRLKALPKPNKSDDAERSAQASARWDTLKKDVRAVASLLLVRMEALLTTCRRVKPVEFDTLFAHHPLIRNLAQRLVWGVYASATTHEAPQQLFRLTEDLECADANDEPVAIDFGEDAQTVIGLVHPLQLSESDKAAWGSLFGDYEIAQPFPQLGRETYALREEEMAQEVFRRFEGVKVETPRLRGMTGRGWLLGEPQDAGCVLWVQRQVSLADGKKVWALLEFSSGLVAGASEFEEEMQTLETMVLSDSDWPWNNYASRFAFGRLGAVSASELLRDLTQLVDVAAV